MSKKNIVVSVFIILIVACNCVSIRAKQNKKTGNINTIRDYIFNKEKKLYSPSTYNIPAYKKRTLTNDDIIFNGYSHHFLRGEIVYITIIPKTDKSGPIDVSKLLINGNTVIVERYRDGYHGFWGIHPNSKSGSKRIVLEYNINGKHKVFKRYFKVGYQRYPVFRRPLNVGKFSDQDYSLQPEVIRFIKECTKKKSAAFKSVTANSISNITAHPRNYHYITSPFWAKRVYLRYKKRKGKKIRLKNKIRIHRGLDFRGKTGEPVMAIASGKIVLAEKLHYEGNMVIIDHGNKVFSYYMHMDSITVKAGDRIKAGEQIGRVGSTGVSTGSHLHVSLIVRGVQVNPLSLLGLPLNK